MMSQYDNALFVFKPIVILGLVIVYFNKMNLLGLQTEPARTAHGTCSDCARNLLGLRTEPARTAHGTCSDCARNLFGFFFFL